MKILLIEDSKLDGIAIMDLLKYRWGTNNTEDDLEIVWERTLRDGMSRLQNSHFDIILLDLNLPDSLGLDTLRILINSYPEIPVVVLTSITDQNFALEAVREGSQDFLIKGNINSEVLIRSINYSIERHKMLMALRSLALIDHLTGLYNRHGFFSLAQHYIKLSHRNGTGLLLLYCDLDDLKGINDTYGHQVGDKVLKEIASILKETFRESDIISRYGGDEFVILALDVNEGSKRILLDRLRENIDIRNKYNKDYKISLSIGAAIYDRSIHKCIEDLISEADKQMYIDKWNKKKGKT